MQISLTALPLKDPSPFAGKNFYRIKSIDQNGTMKYSPVVYVVMESKNNGFIIQPNPVKGNSIHLQFTNLPKGNYQFNLMNALSQLVFSTQLLINNTSTSMVLKSKTVLTKGVYHLQINGPGNKIETQKLLIDQ